MLILGLSVAALGLLTVIIRDILHKRSLLLPPGPSPLPLLGNVFQLPPHFLWRKLHDWSKTYGPMYTIWIMGRPFVILNGSRVAADILDRMSGATAGRYITRKARFFRAFDLVCGEDHTSRWRAKRTAIHASLNVRGTTQFCPLQEGEAANLVLSLLQHPQKSLGEHAHRYSGSVIFRTLYGGKSFPHVGEDSSAHMGDMQKELLKATLPQNSVVDAVPILQPVIARVPWLRREATSWFERTNAEGCKRYDGAVTSEATVVADLEANKEKYGLDKHFAIWVTIGLYMAGAETTHTAVRVLILALLHNPGIAKLAQEQLDEVCGDAPPTFAHRERLPFVEALVKETVRWRPGVPLGIPHVATQNIEYGGYVMPKGTVFVDNLWGQTRDPTVYQDPERFDPSRFLDASGRLLPPAPDTRLDMLAFGHGRRICPGKDFAINGTFIAAAFLLWAFTFEWPVDEHGDQVTCGVDEFVDNALVSTPKPFEVVFRPRREGLEDKLFEMLKE